MTKMSYSLPMKSRSLILVEKSKSAMIAAVETINKPKFPYREEIFLILCANAWELLIKAKWLKEHKNKVSTLYAKELKRKKDKSPSKKYQYKISRSGNPVTHEVIHLINMMNAKSPVIDSNIVKNIELIIEARDCVIHFYTDSFMINKRIREIGLASLENYIYLIKEWFNIEVGEFGFSLLPISIIDTSIPLKSQPSSQERTFLTFLEQCIKEQNNNSDRYIALEVNIGLKRSFVSDAVPVIAIDPTSKMKVAISEEDKLSLFPWDHNTLLEKLKDRYTNFRQDKRFNELKSSVKNNASFSHERKLDPNNKKSLKKYFYSPNCLQYFDKYYTRKTT